MKLVNKLFVGLATMGAVTTTSAQKLAKTPTRFSTEIGANIAKNLSNDTIEIFTFGADAAAKYNIIPRKIVASAGAKYSYSAAKSEVGQICKDSQKLEPLLINSD